MLSLILYSLRISQLVLGDRPLRYWYEVLIQTGCPGDALETRDPNPFLPTNPPFCFSFLQRFLRVRRCHLACLHGPLQLVT
jgi:hypothetical protein